jgi:hypothetical protein
MKTTRMLSLLAVALFGAQFTAARASDQITEEAAHGIGVDTYVYFYPSLSMDITRKRFTNIEPGKEFGKGPMNMFVNVPEYPPADFKGVVRSNFDTLYSIAGFDLTNGQLIDSESAKSTADGSTLDWVSEKRNIARSSLLARAPERSIRYRRFPQEDDVGA